MNNLVSLLFAMCIIKLSGRPDSGYFLMPFSGFSVKCWNWD